MVKVKVKEKEKEITIAAEETIEVAMIAETIALTGRKEESTHLTDKIEEIIAQDKETDKIEMKTEEETGGSIHLKKAEGILVTTDEGDAKGP